MPLTAAEPAAAAGQAPAPAAVADRAPAPAPVVVGEPVRLSLEPATLELVGRHARAQVLVTGHYADGSRRDLTGAAGFSVAPQPGQGKPDAAAPCRSEGAGVITASADGSAELVVTVRSHEGRDVRAVLPVRVRDTAAPDPVSFLYGVLPALAKNGCSSGGCHGSPAGKGGFSLSMLGYDPDFDKLHLVRGGMARRIDLLEPAASLLIRKPLMQVAHGGGAKLADGDAAHRTLLRWIDEGARFDPDGTPTLRGVDVHPAGGLVFRAPDSRQSLRVVARFSDGTSRDVTDLAAYASSDEQVARVTPDGTVFGVGRGPVAISVRFRDEVVCRQFTFVQEVPGYVWPGLKPVNYVDEHVDAQLRLLGIEPAPVAGDERFLRRVHLDVTGLLPTAERTREFLADRTPDKRARLIDELLARPEHARHWAQRQADLLRVTNKRLGRPGATAFAEWLADCYARNVGLDRVAAELITAGGSTLANPPANYWRAFEDTNTAAEATAQLFLGVRISCAKCHNHPFERWTQDDYYGLAANFHRVQRKLETPPADPKDPKKKARPDGDAAMMITLARTGDLRHPRTGRVMEPALPMAGPNRDAPDGDARTGFARWLTAPGNPFFARVTVNRIWAHVMGRGIVEPVDDFRESNPPVNAALLDALAADFVRSGFDQRHILRVILNSRAWQADIPTSADKAVGAAQEKHFAAARVRLLTAEQLLDAVSSLCGMPEKVPATQAAVPSQSGFMTAFGQPARETACQCERVGEPSLEQALQLLNGKTVADKLAAGNGRLARLLKAGTPDAELLAELYLAAFARTPTAVESSKVEAHLAAAQAAGRSRADAWQDVLWALINTREFVFQH